LLAGGRIVPRLELQVFRNNAPAVTLEMDSDVITMGRARDCTIPMDDPFLSRRHAEIANQSDGWVLKDNGSVNGTYLNGARVSAAMPLKPGDRIEFGNTLVVIGGAAEQVSSPEEATSMTTNFILKEQDVKDSAETISVLHRLALELLTDRPVAELFDLILDHVVEIMQPSRAALALLHEPDGSLEIVKMRRMDRLGSDLRISRTLAREVARDRKVLVFTDVDAPGPLAGVESFMEQSIYSALCAPLIAGERVLGLLYVDFLTSRRMIAEADAQLAAQIARVAAVKLESTQLREAALEKGRIEESLELARAIQLRMLPQMPAPDPAAMFDLAAKMLPAKQVGGDFYDYYVSGDGRLFFCIGDVSGKGIPAALTMAVTRALFRSFIQAGRSPGEIMSAINRQLCEETDEAMFVTAFCAVLDLASGALRYVNAGHNPPLVVSADGTVRALPTSPGLVLAYLPQFPYTEQSGALEAGDLLFLYTDGISEAVNAKEEMFTVQRLEDTLRAHASSDVREVARVAIAEVQKFAGEAAQSDDLTLLCVRYRRAGV
jgi:sigma-B regulation protein RsbU (phosphoserine phosphatase)